MQTRRRWHVRIWHVAVVAVLVIAAAIGVLALVALRAPGPLDGQSLGEGELSRTEQLALIDQFSPVPTPPDATDIRIRYQRFQDWSFEASFTLAPDALDQYARSLQPDAASVASATGTERYFGKRIGVFVGWIEIDRAAGRVRVHHTSS